ncbi:hypothetical protein DWU95_23710, partial [Burkholderia contaminans]
HPEAARCCLRAAVPARSPAEQHAAAAPLVAAPPQPRVPQPDRATLAATISAAILQCDQRDGFIGRVLVRMRMRRGSA